MLKFKTNVVIVSEENFYLYDHNKPVETSLDSMINRIVERLDECFEKARGNDHDRLITAFAKIGQELGFVAEKEHAKTGLIVDCVWFDREGKIQVAVEVEATGNAKKDIMTTWELEPKLAIIACLQKTDSFAQSLTSFTLMKSLPHKLLFINPITQSAYLFEKQDILKQYMIKKGENKESMSFEEV